MQDRGTILSLKHLTQYLSVAGAAAFGLLTSIAFAGDKIVFSDEKPTTNPAETKPSTELFRSWNTKLETPSFDYSILGIPTIPRATMDRKEKRRQQNERAEKEQWMFLRPGELQSKEDEKNVLGVATRPLDHLDKEDNEKKDYTFYNLREPKNSQPRQPGEIRSGNETPGRGEQAASAAQREREDPDAEPKRDRTFILPGKEQPGARTSGELDLSGPFDSGKRDTLSSASKSEFSLRDVFASAPVRSDKETAKMKDFNNMLNSAGPSVSVSAGGNSLGSPLSAASAPPAFTRPSDGPGLRPAGANLFDSSVSPNPGSPAGLGNRLNPPGLPNLNSTPGIPGSSPFFPQTPPPQNPSRNFSSPPVEFQRRKG